MSNPSSSALENLVTQFTTPFDALRELVQNSIDAGSSGIEVWCDYEYTEKHGVSTIHIDDFGEGMDEEIIDTKLTRLFSSGKENDLTKIGKFGIGFVSVFALEPQGILLLTGRGGEYWEVFFHPDRSFTKTRIESPVEGTQITIFFEGSPNRHDEIVSEVRKSLKKWCIYAEVDISFEDRAAELSKVEIINEAFGVDGPCQIIDIHPDGTEIAIAFSESPHFSAYNRGLTLSLSKHANSLFPDRIADYLLGISVEIKSRYLEHTLSRDSVVRDQNYEKAMKLFMISFSKFMTNIIQRMTILAGKKDWDIFEAKEYGRHLGSLHQFPFRMFKERLISQFFVRFLGLPFHRIHFIACIKNMTKLFMVMLKRFLVRRRLLMGIPFFMWIKTSGK